MTTQVASPAVVRSGRAHRVPVPRDEPLIGAAAYDYADSFEIRVPESDERSMEEFVRGAIEDAPRSVRELVWLVHRHVLRFRLGPRSSASHVLGWRIKTSERDVFRLEATSTLFGRGIILGRRPDPTRVVVTTYVFRSRPTIGRAIWTLVGPLHRRVAPYLMERARGASQ
jgi:hypothetical protein